MTENRQVNQFLYDCLNANPQANYGDYRVETLHFYEDGYAGVPDAYVWNYSLVDIGGNTIAFFERVEDGQTGASWVSGRYLDNNGNRVRFPSYQGG